MDKMKRLPKALISAARENNLVVFVGAGISSNFVNNSGQVVGDWLNLVKQVLSILEEKYDVYELIQRTEKISCKLSDEQPIDILRAIEQDNRLPLRETLYSISNFYNLSPDLQFNDFSLHKKLASLSDIIITTNYDNAFELALPQINRVLIGKDNPLAEISRETNGTTLFKLHGCISKPESMVLFDSNYKELYGKHKFGDIQHMNALLVNLAFQRLIINKTFLFIGCGMGDWQINYLFGGLKHMLGRVQKHYIISMPPLKNGLEDFLSLIPIYDYNSSELRDIITLLIDEKNKRPSNNKSRAAIQDIKKEKACQSLIDGIGFHLEKEYGLAIQKYRNAIKYNPSYDSAYQNLANVYYVKAREQNSKRLFQLALSYFQTVSEIQGNSDSSTLYNWGSCMSDFAKIDNNEVLYRDSLKLLKKALRIDPGDESIYNNIGTIYTDLALLKQNSRFFNIAIGWFLRAIGLNKNFSDAYYNLAYAFGELASARNDEVLFEDSIKLHEIAARKETNELVICNWGTVLLRLGKLNNNKDTLLLSISKFKQALSIHGGDADIYSNWGNALHKLAQLEDEDDKKIRLLDESLEKYSVAAGLKPGGGLVYKNWGTVMSEKAQIIQSEDLFMESIRLFRVALLNIKDDHGIYNNWGNALYSIMKFRFNRGVAVPEIMMKECLMVYRKAIKMNPREWKLYMNYGVALSLMAKIKEDNRFYRKAYREYQLAADLLPRHYFIYYNWGITLSEHGLLKNSARILKDSVDKFKIALKLHPKDIEVYGYLAKAYFDLCQITGSADLYRESIQVLQKAIEIDSTNHTIYTCYAALLLGIASLTDSSHYYKKCCEAYNYLTSQIDAADLNAYYNWGMALFRYGSYKQSKMLLEQSVEKFRIVVEADPDDDGANYNLGIAIIALAKLCDKDKNLFSEGLAMCMRAYEIEPDYAYHIAQIFALNHDKQNALKYLIESLNNNLVSIDEVSGDNSWEFYHNDKDFLSVINEK